MPELPEVEVVKRSLANKVQNLIIKEVRINDGRLRYRINKNEIRKIVGLKLTKIERRAKFLLFFFSKNTIMLVHLGMTGKFFFVNSKNVTTMEAGGGHLATCALKPKIPITHLKKYECERFSANFDRFN